MILLAHSYFIYSNPVPKTGTINHNLYILVSVGYVITVCVVNFWIWINANLLNLAAHQSDVFLDLKLHHIDDVIHMLICQWGLLHN